ncbi:MAG: AmmeMemoRadiSam system radical SAM enzyme [Nitrospirota bacterium]
MKESILYERLDKERVKCNVCQIRCIISESQRGFCRTRLNRGGKLYTLIYGIVSSINADPIEKKPLYHFYPGSRCLSLGSIGCNFRCPGCQNWGISHAEAEESIQKKRYEACVTPDETVTLIEESSSDGIAWTYNEPTIWFEYTLEGAKRAKERGFYTVYVTNGYISKEALDIIGPYLDAFRVDIKGFSESVYKKITGIKRFEGILDAAIHAKKRWGMHVECITNITSGLNDDISHLRDIALWIVSKLGKETPWHVTRFHPHLEFSDIPPTSVSSLEKARDIGIKEGLQYVYIGNLPGHDGENTYCHGCGKLLINRRGYYISDIKIVKGRCSFCGVDIPGRFISL